MHTEELYPTSSQSIMTNRVRHAVNGSEVKLINTWYSPTLHLISSPLLHQNWWTCAESWVWYNIGQKSLWNNLVWPFEALIECNEIVGMNGDDKCWSDKLQQSYMNIFVLWSVFESPMEMVTLYIYWFW